VDPAYITPFVSSISKIFETMLQLPLSVGSPGIKSEATPTYDVSGIIGMPGEVEAIKADVGHYVVKPFTPDLMDQRIKETLERCAAA